MDISIETSMYNSNPWHKHAKWPPSDLMPGTLTLVDMKKL